MITANVCEYDGETTKNLGDHVFLVVPRIGDPALLYVDGEPVSLTITGVFHYPKPVDGIGPGGKPEITITAKERRFRK